MIKHDWTYSNNMLRTIHKNGHCTIGKLQNFQIVQTLETQLMDLVFVCLYLFGESLKLRMRVTDELRERTWGDGKDKYKKVSLKGN